MLWLVNGLACTTGNHFGFAKRRIQLFINHSSFIVLHFGFSSRIFSINGLLQKKFWTQIFKLRRFLLISLLLNQHFDDQFLCSHHCICTIIIGMLKFNPSVYNRVNFYLQVAATILAKFICTGIVLEFRITNWNFIWHGSTQDMTIEKHT